MATVMEKEEAHRLIERMPQNATWDDLMHEIYVREAIERGLTDSKAGRTRDVREVRAKYGLPEGRFTGQTRHRSISTPSTPTSRRIPPNTPSGWLTG